MRGTLLALVADVSAVVAGGDVAATETAGSLTLVSAPRRGALENVISGQPAVSPDGRYVAFVSAASNLVPGETNKAQDVFVYDRVTGGIDRVSVPARGAPRPYQASSNPAISRGGRFVAFVTRDALVPGSMPGSPDVYVRDRVVGKTVRISAGGATAFPAISANGRYVAFQTAASHLVPGMHGGVVVHDLKTGHDVLASVSSTGAPARAAFEPAISADGRYVVFRSDDPTLVPGDTNQVEDVFLRDLARGVTSRVSLVGRDGQLTTPSATRPALSAGGRYVAFSTSCGYVCSEVWVRDTKAGTSTLVSAGSDGHTVPSTSSSWPSISADGRFVAFRSDATLVPAKGNCRPDCMQIYVRDLRTRRTILASRTASGWRADAPSDWPSVSADGHVVAFETFAGNLSPRDRNTCPIDGEPQSCLDVYLRKLP